MDHRSTNLWSHFLLLFAVLTLTLPLECTSKRILFYQGIAVGFSHQIAITPLLDLLADQGHQITFFSPYKYAGTGNVTNVSIDHFVTANKAFSEDSNFLSTTLRTYGITVPFFTFLPACYLKAKEALETKEYTDWLKSSNFDAVILDGAGDEVIYAMADVWKARVIRYMPWSGLLHFDGPLFGIPSEYSLGMPILSGCYPEEGQELWMFEKMMNYIQYWASNIVFDYVYLPGIDRLIRQHGLVALSTPSLRELIPQVTDLVMVSWDAWNHLARPLLPNVVTLAPMVVDRALKTKPLPKDIQDFIGSDDFIYASFGTFVDSKLFPKHLIDALFQGLGALPVKVLLKWDDLGMRNVPPNIMLRKFYPQIDVLAHPNIKVYFQQGGFNGFSESIVHGVPSVILPIILDMDLNAFVADRRGFGKQLNMESLTKELIRDTILEVLHNKTYKENVQKYSAVSRQDDRNTRATMLNLINRLLNGEDLQYLKRSRAEAGESMDVLALLFFLVYGALIMFLYGFYFGLKTYFRRKNIWKTNFRLKKE